MSMTVTLALLFISVCHVKLSKLKIYQYGFISTQRQQHTYGRDRQLVIVTSICQHRDNNNIHMDEIDNW
jgi:hypothetical protein